MKKQMLDFTILIEQDEDGIYVAKVPEIAGCHTQGKTVEEALERIREAIEVCLEGDKEEVVPLKFIGIQKMQVERPFSI
jgi:predicted RNase H-like HicB family nuclease